ncbi:hypothetical protein [Sphingomonas aracearum]|uniref:Uncharacterized protein n=1 Tax=Sphingomonas aracearum TaxID=2283317 RepID=A0A369VUH0_9SPHN|nr:hypothetical protein [Sphingomonas aracearum]RDE04840.1 hypothetical protein DVW87_14815 [Sphingomonas aracearum]
MRHVAPLLLLLLAAAPPATERTVSGDGVVAARIGAATLRLRIDPAATAMPLIHAEAAARAGLKPGMFGIGYRVGPERVTGRTAVARIELGDGTALRRRIGWTQPHYAPDVDGVIGPGGLDEPVVRFVLGPGRPGERTVALPMMDQGGMAAGWGERFARLDVGGQPMRVRFDPHGAHTLATAGAAARLAQSNGGTLSGKAEPVPIVFGISRPARPLDLAKPLEVGPLSIAHLLARTADFGSTAGIPDKEADPDEVVVVAKGKHDPSRDRLSLGADVLGRCSALVFDKPAGVVRLTCG